MNDQHHKARELVQEVIDDLQNLPFESVQSLPGFHRDLLADRFELATTVKQISDHEIWVMVEAWWPIWLGKRSVGRGLVFERDQGVRDASQNELAILENE